jgi:Sec-independent protein secretion pathway component TatC
MALVMGPMIVLYFFSILLASIAERSRIRRKLSESDGGFQPEAPSPK